MAVITPPFVQQGGSHPAATFRQMLMAVTGSPTGAFAGGVQPTTGGGGHGVAGPADLVATQNGTPNMSVNVAAGGCFVRGTEAAAQGVYAAFNDATLNVVIAASDPTNPRRDLLVMRVRDAFYSGGSTDVALAIVTGTPAGAPVDPTVPANCLVIARISVAAAVTTIVTANIASLAPRASSLGGSAVVSTASLLPTGADVWTGRTAHVLDVNTMVRYNGTTWVVLSEPAQAWTAYTPTLTNATAATVTGAYQQIGKTGRFRINVAAGTATAAGTFTATLPPGWTTASSIASMALDVLHNNGGGMIITVSGRVVAGATVCTIYASTAGANFTLGQNIITSISGTIELA